MRTGAVNSATHELFEVPHDDVRFADRHDAGRQLAAALERFREQHPVVVALPRGGVPIAAEIAQALEAPLDVILVRKIGAPWQPEYAIGAVAEGGVRVLAESELDLLGIGAAELNALIAKAERELTKRSERYRDTRPPLEVKGRTVVLVDDGLATGRTAQAAAIALRRQGAARVVLVVPVAAAQSVREVEESVDEVVALQTPEDLIAIGFWYRDFSPTADEEVTALLTRSTSMSTAHERLVEGGAGVLVPGNLTIPEHPRGIVAFAHGSGSSRLSPRNRQVAQALNADGFATLLFDLLTPEEELDQVSAVVSRGGRPDLAAPRLGEVLAPTLLIVGGLDPQVLELNREAQRQLHCTNDLEVVVGATHLFEEPGTLEAVARLASDWFARHRAGTQAPEPARHET
ncbi:MAG: phosphoribosyltransferase family protein [Solirubrobacteraceae bacterium]